MQPSGRWPTGSRRCREVPLRQLFDGVEQALGVRGTRSPLVDDRLERLACALDIALVQPDLADEKLRLKSDRPVGRAEGGGVFEQLDGFAQPLRIIRRKEAERR